MIYRKSFLVAALCLIFAAVPALAQDESGYVSHSTTSGVMRGPTTGLGQSHQKPMYSEGESHTSHSTTSGVESGPRTGLGQEASMGGQEAGTAGETSESMSMEKMQTSHVLNQIHHVNQKEIQVSKLAIEKGQSQQVKDYAQHMIKDHEKADQKVQALAKSQNIHLAEFQPADFEKAQMDQLGSLSGAQFDHAFLDAMRMGHKMVANNLQLAKDESKDQQLKDLISSILPTVKEHQKTAANVERRSSEMAGEASFSE